MGHCSNLLDANRFLVPLQVLVKLESILISKIQCKVVELALSCTLGAKSGQEYRYGSGMRY